MRVPRRKRISLLVRMQRPVPISITSVEHQLDRLALQLATTNPDQRTNPRRHPIDVQRLSRRECVEIANQHMKPILVALNAIEQRADLTRAPALVPLRKSRTEMQAKHTR